MQGKVTVMSDSFDDTPTADNVQPVVRARKFELVDEAGRMRAQLGLPVEDAPSLALYDEEGKNRARLSLHGDGRPGLILYSREG